jgi:hypothetical protein
MWFKVMGLPDYEVVASVNVCAEALGVVQASCFIRVELNNK